MSLDYSKKKNAELEELLKARSLPHTGKKAELVARLQADDAAASAPAPSTTPAAPAPANEDVIDWDDDAAAAAANPVAVPSQVPAVDPQSAEGTTVEQPPAEAPSTAAEPAAPKQDFSAHIPVTSLDAELEKRKARAARFGLPVADEATKALQRAKRFGASEVPSVAKGLDQALPDRAVRERKRGREEDGKGGRETKRQDSRKRGEGGAGGRGGMAQRGGRAAASAPAGAAGAKKAAVVVSSQQAEKDRIAAEKRKNRFAAPTAAASS